MLVNVYLHSHPSFLNKFFLTKCSEILFIPNDKSYGLYSSHTKLLKLSSSTIAPVLSELLNISIKLGSYPSKLKIAKITPIFKSDDESDANNYRPISLLSNFNRIFEKIMYKEWQAILSNIIYYICPNSTQHAILDIINDIQANMNQRLLSCGVFIYLKKALDTVDYEILLNKLNHYGFRGVINDWFSSYLNNRTQTTQVGQHISVDYEILLNKLNHYGFRGVINDWFSSYLNNRTQTTQVGQHISDKAIIICGVPQGSVLGPLLFLLYVNDIHKCSNKLRFYLFAHHTNILYADKSVKALETTINIELGKFYVWLTANKLTLNTKKSNFIVFHPYQKQLAYQPKICMFDNEQNKYVDLKSEVYINYLGVLIDKNLSWKHHIDAIATKISKNVGLIAKLRHYVPRKILFNVYKSLIRSSSLGSGR